MGLFEGFQDAHRLRVIFKHFSGLLFGAPFLHTLPLQVSLLRLLENLIRSSVSAQKLVRFLGRQGNLKKTPEHKNIKLINLQDQGKVKQL